MTNQIGLTDLMVYVDLPPYPGAYPLRAIINQAFSLGPSGVAW
ncbi:hypothetical protein [Algoriphagus confluentis]